MSLFGKPLFEPSNAERAARAAFKAKQIERRAASNARKALQEFASMRVEQLEPNTVNKIKQKGGFLTNSNENKALLKAALNRAANLRRARATGRWKAAGKFVKHARNFKPSRRQQLLAIAEEPEPEVVPAPRKPSFRNRLKEFREKQANAAAKRATARAQAKYEATVREQPAVQARLDQAKLLRNIVSNDAFVQAYNKLGIIGRRTKLYPANKREFNARYNRKKAANKAVATAEKANTNAAAKKEAAEKKAVNNANAASKKKEAAEKKAANNANAASKKKAANNAKKAVISERNARNALKKYLNATVKPTYNKALVNAILRLPKENLNNNTRRRLQAPRMYALQRGAGAFRNRAVTAGGALGRGAVTAGGALGRGAGALGRGAGALGRGAGGFFSRLFAPKPVGATEPPSFIPFKKDMKIPFGYVLKRNNKNKGLGYYMNNKALASQLEQRGYGPAPKPASNTTGVSVGVGPGPRNRNRYGNNYGYGNRNRGGGGGGIIFKPQITVGAARIGAQTFGGTRVGGQTMGGSRATTGNVGGTRVTTGNAGRLTVSAPTTNGNRQLAATSEQLIRGAGGAEAVEQGIKALNAANGNVARAKAASRLPNNTFTNIYAMGGPNAAKKLVEQRRRRRTVGGRRAPTKKRVAQKPRKQYIKLTPYQFRRLTDHIKKNNLRKVLIKEITH